MGEEEGDLPRSLGFVLEVRSGKTDERSGRLRRFVQNMSLLLRVLFGYLYQSMQREIGFFTRSSGRDVSDEMRCAAKRAGYH